MFYSMLRYGVQMGTPGRLMPFLHIPQTFSSSQLPTFWCQSRPSLFFSQRTSTHCVCVTLTQHLNHAGVRTMPLFRVSPTLTTHWMHSSHTAPIRNWMHRTAPMRNWMHRTAPMRNWMHRTAPMRLARFARFCLLGMPNSNLGLPWMGSILSSPSGYYC